MGRAGEHEQLEVVARRLAETAPPGWARVLSRWVATGTGAGAAGLDEGDGPDGPDRSDGRDRLDGPDRSDGRAWLDGVTTAVVDGGDRWLYGWLGDDPVLREAVAALRASCAGEPRWTTLDLTLDPDGTIAVELGHDAPTGPDAAVSARLEHGLDTWVAEHGPVPPRDPQHASVTLTPEQAEVVRRVARSHAEAAPEGWLRIVTREECSVADGTDGIASVRVVVVETPEGLEQQHFRPSRELHFERGDLLRELAAQSPTQAVVLDLLVDRDGSHRFAVTHDVPRVLDGVRDETSSGPVHDYLELHRDELTRLLR